jgi:2-dehydro-3-deoxy-D-arabinonate dehydratase
VQLTEVESLRDQLIGLEIVRAGRSVFRGEARTSKMNRRFEELVDYMFRELEFPWGVFLMTGTGIVPRNDFTLQVGDRVRITVDSLTLENEVGA